MFGIAIACLLALELGILGLAAHRGRPTPPLTEAERQAPVTEQTPNGLVLCHAQLGFRIPLGTTTLVFSDELTQKAATHASERSVARWVYRESRGSVVIISGARGFDSEESLRNYAKGFTDSADETKEVAKTRESIDWQTGSGSMDLAADTSAGLKLEMRCLASGAGVLVCVETIGANPAELQSFRSGVALESCR